MRYIIYVLFVFINLELIGQPLDYLQFQLDKYNNKFSPEYIDSHTDRELYFTGDRLWYAFYLQKVGSPQPLSIAGYAELRDQNDSVLFRQKIKFHNGIGSNEFIIPNHLPTGVYQFVGYTLWMKNNSSFHRKYISIINSTFPYDTSAYGNLEPRLLNPTIVDGKHLSIANISTASSGKLIFFTREKVIEEHKINDLKELIPIPHENSVPLYASFTEESGARIDMIVRQSGSLLVIDTNKKLYKPRESVTVDLTLKDENGNKVDGNISITVHRKDEGLTYFSSADIFNQWLTWDDKVDYIHYRKEIFLFPQTVQLPMVKFQSQKAVPFKLDAKSLFSTIGKAELNRKISKSYGVITENENSITEVLPFNLSYRPDDYTGFTTLEDFIRESVAPVKVKKMKSVRSALIRNSENSNNVHFFKEPALLLADGVIVNSIDEMMKIELSDVERLDLMWGTKEINASGIFALADNGILSVTTKSKTILFSGERLFGNIHFPSSFHSPSLNKESETLPLFYTPVYWNPEVFIRGTQRINFELSDELGQFVIRAKGMTKTGKMVIAEQKYNVATER